MLVEGIFDGTAVRPLEPLDLQPNQRVFIEIPKISFSKQKEEEIREKLAALDSIFGMLSPEEEKVYDEALSHRLNFTDEINL